MTLSEGPVKLGIILIGVFVLLPLFVFGLSGNREPAATPTPVASVLVAEEEVAPTPIVAEPSLEPSAEATPDALTEAEVSELPSPSPTPQVAGAVTKQAQPSKAPAPTAAAVAPKAEPTKEPVQPAPTKAAQKPPASCSADTYNCGDFGSCAEVMAVFNQCSGDPHGLDGDDDGVPCEALCK